MIAIGEVYWYEAVLEFFLITLALVFDSDALLPFLGRKVYFGLSQLVKG